MFSINCFILFDHYIFLQHLDGSLARAVLAEVPKQLTDHFKYKNLQPLKQQSTPTNPQQKFYFRWTFVAEKQSTLTFYSFVCLLFGFLNNVFPSYFHDSVLSHCYGLLFFLINTIPCLKITTKTFFCLFCFKPQFLIKRYVVGFYNLKKNLFFMIVNSFIKAWFFFI